MLMEVKELNRSEKSIVTLVIDPDTGIRYVRKELKSSHRPGVKFCVSDFRQSQEWRWKAGRILAWIP